MKNTNELKKNIEEYLAKYFGEWNLSGNVLVMKDNEVLVKMAYGYSNIEHSVKNETDTKFNVASLTKAFTASAIMILKERGMLSTNDSISKYLPEYPEFAKEITIQHLLSHSSGIINYNNIEGYDTKIKKLFYTQGDFVNLFKKYDLEFKPGEGFSYSNSGYYFLGLIIEKISGVSYEEFIEENILKPLGMSNSGIFNEKKIIKNIANGYELQGDKLVNDSYSEWTKIAPSGGLYTNIGDMIKWTKSITNKALFSSDSYEEMFTKYNDQYGYGWFINKYDDKKRYSHNGAFNGYMSQINIFPEERITILIMSNYRFTPVWDICDKIADILFKGKVPVVKKPELFNIDKSLYGKFIGEYEDLHDENIIVTIENERFYMQLEEPHKFEIYPISDNTFQHILIDEKYEFLEDGVNVFGCVYKKII